MSVISNNILAGAAGAAGGEALYVDDVFSTYLYDGTGSSGQTITNGIDLSGEGGLYWMKNRTTTADNMLFDTERASNKVLVANTSAGEATDNTMTPTSTGFTISGGSTNTNNSSFRYCSWTFRKAPGFFDVVTYTGNGTSQNISHNLGSVPGAIFIKCTTNARDWVVYHRSTGATKYLQLNQTTAASTNSFYFDDTAPTANSFRVADAWDVNKNGETFVAYLFAHDDQSFGTGGNEAIIKCGGVTTGSDEYATVNLGFEPQFVMFKRTDVSGDWLMLDTMRGWNLGNDDKRLYANLSNAESTTSSGHGEVNSTGFRIYNLGGSADLIYIAIRRPHKPPEVGTDVFNPSTQVGTVPNFAANFPVDFAIRLLTAGGNTTYSQMAVTRLTGEKFLATSQTNVEATPSGFSIDWDHMDGWGDLGGSGHGLSFKRAPGFFDVVTYTGTGVNRTVSHNLGVAPELMIVKRRSSAEDWAVYTATTGNQNRLLLNLTTASSASSNTWNNTSPTSSVFSLGTSVIVNGNADTYIAYLFASLPGISKVGTYSGTGTNGINVDCGFTAGARFVMIKRTDNTGNWFVWDSNRGIVSGIDPYIFLNSTSAQDTTTDHIDPLNSGFTVNGSNTTHINASGGTYLFLAIA